MKMKPSLVFMLITLVLVVQGDHIDVSSYPFSATLATDSTTGETLYQLYWTFDRTAETITFSVQVKTTGWVGFGLSPNGGMIGSDLVIGWVTNEGTFFQDRYADAEAVPPEDTSQDWTLLEGEESNGSTFLTFTRKWVTCDEYDRDVVAGTSRVVFSWNSNDPSSPESPAYHEHRGTKSLNLLGGLVEPPTLPSDVASFKLVLDNVPVPEDRDTIYWCAAFKLPQEVLNQKRYIVKWSPRIQPGNQLYVHHMIMYHCSSLNETTDLGPGSDCAEGAFRNCGSTSILAAWAVGGEDFIYPEGVAYPIGGLDEQRPYVTIQMHYDNYNLDKNVKDSSGIEFFYTNTVPEHEAGVVIVGHRISPYMVIPPNAAHFAVYGACQPDCTENYIPPTGINVFSHIFHTHLAGAGLTIQHFRQNDTCPGGYEELKPIDENLSYDFDFQQYITFPQAVKVLPGDIILLKCYYNTEQRSGVTLAGESTREEMCFSVMQYYPNVPGWRSCQTATDFNSYGSFFDQHMSEFEEEGQYAITTGNLSAFGTTGHEVVAGLFNKLEWTPEQVDDLQGIHINGTLTSLCRNTDGTKFFSAYNTLPENQCPYQPPEGPCHTDSTDDADGAGMTTAVNGLVFLMLANMFTLVFW